MNTSGPTAKSIHNLPPLERGGTIARQGFDVQDHVAVCFLLELIDQPLLQQVWCETHDDITLIWKGSNGEEIEFVQVKSNELDQLWTVAKLCEREKKEKEKVAKKGSSIFERSLANDRCDEPRRFRLVTCRPVHSDLYALTLDRESPDRVATKSDLKAIASDVHSRTQYRSANGNDAEFWISNLLWDVVHSIDYVKKSNLVKLRKLIELQGGYLFSDQLDDLYSTMLAKVRDAAVADWGKAPEQKKFYKLDIQQWLAHELAKRHNAIPKTAGTALSVKMNIAGIVNTEIDSCLETRRYYLAERLQPKYLSLVEREFVEGEVTATLHALRSQLDAGELLDSGVAFHSKCISALQELQQRLPTSRPVPLAFLLGCMYTITDRCTHRFKKVSA